MTCKKRQHTNKPSTSNSSKMERKLKFLKQQNLDFEILKKKSGNSSNDLDDFVANVKK